MLRVIVANLCLVALFVTGPMGSVWAKGVTQVDAVVVRVIDGDSLVVKAKIWVKQTVETTVRVRGVDAPEIKGKCKAEKTAAEAAKQYVQRLLKGGSKITLHGVARDKYGDRVVADVVLPDGSDLKAMLIKSKHARAYNGGKRAGWCRKP